MSLPSVRRLQAEHGVRAIGGSFRFAHPPQHEPTTGISRVDLGLVPFPNARVRGLSERTATATRSYVGPILSRYVGNFPTCHGIVDSVTISPWQTIPLVSQSRPTTGNAPRPTGRSRRGTHAVRIAGCGSRRACTQPDTSNFGRSWRTFLAQVPSHCGRNREAVAGVDEEKRGLSRPERRSEAPDAGAVTLA